MNPTTKRIIYIIFSSLTIAVGIYFLISKTSQDVRALSTLTLIIGLLTLLNSIFKDFKNYWIVSGIIILFMIINYSPKIVNSLKPNSSINKNTTDSLSENLWINEPEAETIYGDSTENIAKTIIDTLTTKGNDVVNNNSEAISFLKQLLNNDTSELTSKESIRMQLRLFYAVIFTALMSLLFTIKSTSKQNIINMLLIVILAIFSLEIHLSDTYKRSNAAYQIRAKAIEIMINNKLSESVSYKLDFRTLHEKMKSASKGSLKRKILTAFVIDPERLIFYVFPFILLLIYDIVQFKNRPKFIVHHGFTITSKEIFKQ